jgi:hypothetical protein
MRFFRLFRYFRLFRFSLFVFPSQCSIYDRARYISRNIGGKQVLTVLTSGKPGIAALDPFHKMIERSAGNNSLKIAALPVTGS